MAAWLAADGLAYKTAERCREARDTSKAALSLTRLLTSGVKPLLTLTLTLTLPCYLHVLHVVRRLSHLFVWAICAPGM